MEKKRKVTYERNQKKYNEQKIIKKNKYRKEKKCGKIIAIMAERQREKTKVHVSSRLTTVI